MKIGSDNIGSLYLGTEKISKAYLGTELVHGKELPYDAKVEYLQSSGTQYIDTGIKLTDNIRYELKAQYTANNEGFDTMLGCFATNPNRYGVLLGLQKSTSEGKLYLEVGYAVDGVSVAVKSDASPTALHMYKGGLANGTNSFDVDGTVGTTAFLGAYPANLNLWLFARNREGVAGNQSSAKLYYCKIWNGGNLVFDAYPVRVGQVGYLYDTVSGQLFGNDGTGAFTLGADVDKEMSLRMSKSFIADNPTLTTEWGDQWSYKHGLVLRAILMAYDNYSGITGKDVSSLLTYAKKYYHDHIGLVNGNVGIISPTATYIKTDYNSDNVQPGYNLFRLKQLDIDTTYQGYYENVISILVDQLADQPRLAEPTSVSGTAGHPFQHKAAYTMQHWLDGDFMVEPFRALYAHDRLSGQTQEDMYDDIVEQLINAAEITKDTSTQLYRHAYAGQGSSASWSENGANTPGRAYFAWGRALGWYILAINEVLDIIPSTHNPTRRSVLTGILSNLLTRLLTYRDTSGVWPLLPTLAVDTTNNKLEATSSCMYAYGYLHGVRMGYLSADMRDTALSIYHAVVRNFVVSVGASVTLKNCVTGGNPGASSTTQTDVLNNYYSKPFADNDEHGVGPFIMAALEHELLTSTT